MTRLIKDLIVGMKVGGWVHKCLKCGQLFIGRKDANYCSPACRVAAHRKEKP